MTKLAGFWVVPEVGLEPTQGFPYRILSPARLPFHHSGTVTNSITNKAASFKDSSDKTEAAIVYIY